MTDKWRVLSKINDNTYILVKSKNNKTIYAPLIIYSFRFINGHTYKECEQYNFVIKDFDELTQIGDKLRYIRLNKGLYQDEVAEKVGIDRSTYISYERGVKIYPYDVMIRLSKLYNIDVNVLLDDYHRFIYNNQGKNIKTIRKSLGLKQYELANELGVSLTVIKRAEQEEVRFLRKNFEKLINYYKSIC